VAQKIDWKWLKKLTGSGSKNRLEVAQKIDWKWLKKSTGSGSKN
jgi:hypothetical protein